MTVSSDVEPMSTTDAFALTSRMRERYSQAVSYRDAGTAKLTRADSGEIVLEGAFDIQLVRERSFDFRFVPPDMNAVAIHWRVGERVELRGIDLAVEHLPQALLTLKGVSVLSSYITPSLLFADAMPAWDAWPNATSDVANSIRRTEDDESVIDVGLRRGVQISLRERDACLLRVSVVIRNQRFVSSAPVSSSSLCVVTYAPELT